MAAAPNQPGGPTARRFRSRGDRKPCVQRLEEEMSRKCRVGGRPLRPCALAGTLFVGLMSAGCFYIGEDESRAEVEIEEVRESVHEVADEFADGLADAVSHLTAALHDVDLELSA